MQRILLPDFVSGILTRLRNVGYESYIVGGCVRDALLGRVPSDFDITTAARPEEVMRLFEKTAPTGLSYGTVTVFFEGGAAEVTTFRSESGYADFRRPANVAFVGGIREDLARRDFTFNAMAFAPETGLIDPFHGEDDLARKTIRAVGDPELRFREDALRMLRALRFAARLGFTIEPQTLSAIEAQMPLAAALSGERIKGELDRLLLTVHPSAAFETVRLGLWRALGIPAAIPESFRAIDKLPCRLPLRWAAFLELTGADAGEVFKRLKFDGGTKRTAAALLKAIRMPPPETETEIRLRLSALQEPVFRDYLALSAALTGEDMYAAEELLDRVLCNNDPYRIDMLAINGGDLLAKGFKPGPSLGELLRRLLLAVVTDPRRNTREELLRLAEEFSIGSPDGRPISQ